MTTTKEVFLDLVAEADDAAADLRAEMRDLLALSKGADSRLRDAISATLANRIAYVVSATCANELLDADQLCERLGMK